MAIIQVCGKPRTGKSSLVAAIIVNEHMGYYNENWRAACSYIRAQDKMFGLNRTLPPQHHVVFSDFDIYTRHPRMKSYPITGWEFGVAKAPIYTKPLVPYGIYAFDEAQRYYDSKGDKLPWWVTQAFELHGHIFLTIYLISQRYIRISSDIRELTEKFIYIEKCVHTYIVENKNGHKHKIKSDKFLSEGELVHTTWLGREFSDGDMIDDYVKRGIKCGEKYRYDFDGNIKEHYNPYAFAEQIESTDRDFDFCSRFFEERPQEWNRKNEKISNLKSKETKKEEKVA